MLLGHDRSGSIDVAALPPERIVASSRVAEANVLAVISALWAWSCCYEASKSRLSFASS